MPEKLFDNNYIFHTGTSQTTTTTSYKLWSVCLRLFKDYI